MNKFTHGIMVLHAKTKTENGDYLVVHFVGYWEEPTEVDLKNLLNELINDPKFDFRDVFNELEFFPATQGCLDFYNKQVERDDVFNSNDINLN
jgi:hypothetical protein